MERIFADKRKIFFFIRADLLNLRDPRSVFFFFALKSLYGERSDQRQS
jgi:hypothetical protein